MRWQVSPGEKPFIPVKHFLLLLGAFAAFATAFMLVYTAGLPDRAEFTGQVVPGQLPIAPEINAVAPLFQLSELNGEIIRLSDLHGVPVIINFWATWCEPCRVEMSILQALYETQKDKGLRILAVNLGETDDKIRDWQTMLGLTYDMLVDEQQTVAALYRLRGQPSTYIISPNGIITSIFYGPASESALTSALRMQ
jgi:peroxiredoxin